MMKEQKQRRPAWKSPFKVGLAVVSGLAYAVTCTLESQFPGDIVWLYYYGIIFLGSLICSYIEPDRFLVTAAMPYLGVFVLGLVVFADPFFLVAMIIVLTASVPGAFLGAVIRRIENATSRVVKRNKVQHNQQIQPIAGKPGSG